VNFKLLEDTLNEKMPVIVKFDEKINLNEFNKLCELTKKYKINEISKFVEHQKRTSPQKAKKFLLEQLCVICQTVKTILISRTKLLIYLEKCDNFCCECCEQEKKDKLTCVQNTEYKKNIQVEYCENSFVDTFLNPERSFIKGFSKKYLVITNVLKSLNHNIIKNYIEQMDYNDFLKTPYWDAIRTKKMQNENFKCQVCNSGGKLNVHHKTYENHGEEHLHLADLTVLCCDCHGKFHEGSDE